jgi:hypothetical protein
VRLLVRAAVVVAAAGGFLAALAVSASADVVEPSSAYQPASTALLEEGAPGPAAELAVPEPSSEPKAEPPPVAETRDVPVATPAPEHQVRAVPVHIARREPEPRPAGLPAAVRPFVTGVERIGAYLGRVVSACQVAAGSGAGVPVLALAVLSVATALTRRRVIGTRSIADEEARELLFAGEVIAPG